MKEREREGMANTETVREDMGKYFVCLQMTIYKCMSISNHIPTHIYTLAHTLYMDMYVYVLYV